MKKVISLLPVTSGSGVLAVFNDGQVVPVYAFAVWFDEADGAEFIETTALILTADGLVDLATDRDFKHFAFND